MWGLIFYGDSGKKGNAEKVKEPECVEFIALTLPPVKEIHHGTKQSREHHSWQLEPSAKQMS